MGKLAVIIYRGGIEVAREEPEWSQRFSDANFNAMLKTRVF
jgi:hypothetical protein